MNYQFKKSSSTFRPEIIDLTSSGYGIYYRKNIEQVEIEDEETKEKRIEFQYDEIYLPNNFRFEINDIEIYAAKIEELLEKFKTDFEKLKNKKYKENDNKADEKRYNQEFTLVLQEKVCTFDTSAKTQSDLLTAFAVCSTGSTYDGWITNNGIEINLTLEDVAIVSAKFKELSDVYIKWNEYKEMIDKAETIEEVEKIEINYNQGE